MPAKSSEDFKQNSKQCQHKLSDCNNMYLSEVQACHSSHCLLSCFPFNPITQERHLFCPTLFLHAQEVVHQLRTSDSGNGQRWNEQLAGEPIEAGEFIPIADRDRWCNKALRQSNWRRCCQETEREKNSCLAPKKDCYQDQVGEQIERLFCSSPTTWCWNIND